MDKKAAKMQKKMRFFACAIVFCVFKHKNKFVLLKKTPYLCSTLKELKE